MVSNFKKLINQIFNYILSYYYYTRPKIKWKNDGISLQNHIMAYKGGVRRVYKFGGE